MPQIIMTSALEAATNADILASGRLQTVPSNGWLEFEMQAADAAAANNYTVSIQLPDGTTPLTDTLIPAGNSVGLPGVIDDRTALVVRFPIAQGGHCVFSCTETGDTELMHRVTFRPAALGA